MNRWIVFILFILFSSTDSLHAQTELIDSLKVAIITSPDNTVKVENLILLSRNLGGIDSKNAIYYGTRARDLASTLDYAIGQATALKYIGNAYYYQGIYTETIHFWEQALAIYEKIDDKAGVANILSNLGGLNSMEGDDNRALELSLRSLAIAEEINDSLRIASALGNIALVYSKKPATYAKARDYYLRTLHLFEGLGDDISVGYANGDIGELFFAMGQYQTSLFYFNKTLETFIGTADEPFALNYIGRIFAKRGEYAEAHSTQARGLNLARSFNASKDIVTALLGIAETYSLQGNSVQALKAHQEAIALAQQSGFKDEMRDIYEGMALSYADLLDFRNAFKYQQLLTGIKDTLYITANQKKLDLINANFENEKQQGEIDLLTKDQALQAANLQKQKVVRNAFFGGFVVIFIIAFIIFRNYQNKVKTNKLLDKQNEKIEGLLLNILPEKVAYELQHDGYATPRDYESATILFTDFKGFTNISSGLLPHELIAELNSYFNEFDDIIGQHNLEKIKTIGDAYMCAGGIPTSNTTHPADAVEAGLAIQEYIINKNIKRVENGQTPWELRVGIHTGHIVAGVVGSKKYAYDIWGDAVNIASRMESNGEAGKVNISEATYTLVKDKFNCTTRGKISVKGAGEKNMYFVDSIKQVSPEAAETAEQSAEVIN